MSQIDWSKAPEGATHYGPAVEREWLACWHKKVDGQWLGWLADGDIRWGPAGNTVERMKQLISRPQEWTGEGLPPVGMVCEFKSTQNDGPHTYEPVEIMYISNVTVVAKRLDENRGMEEELICHPATARFRPIRTPEQIAAEEREAKAKAMWQQIYFNTDPDYWDHAPEGTRDTFRAAIDAGWQKVKS